MSASSFIVAIVTTVAASWVAAAPLPPGDYELEPGGRYTFTVAGAPVPATYALTTQTSGTGDGTVSGAGAYAAGATVSLTATAAPDSTFTGWSPSPCAASFAMPAAPLTCTATFTRNVVPPATYPVAIATTGSGTGTATGAGSFAPGATVMLGATPDTGSTFAGWSPSPCAASFAMPAAPLTCTATFDKTVTPPATYQLAIAIAGTGGGTAVGAGAYAAGDTVTLQATPASGSTFGGWSPAPCASTFTMPSSALTCTATFTLVPPPTTGPKWVLLNPGPVVEAQYGANFELGAAFDPVRNRIFAPDQRGYAWVYDLIGTDKAVIRPLNAGARFRGGERNCSFAYLPTIDAAVTINCGTSANPPDGFPVFTFPDDDTVATTYQCTNCGGPAWANFLGWSETLGAVVGVGGWGASQDTVQTYAMPGGAFPAPQSPWTVLPQAGAIPDYTGCWMCKEAMRRGVLRNGQYVFVDPLTYDLHTYDFTTSTWARTLTSKPAPLPVNGVVGYDPVRDVLVVWVGTDALYGTGPAVRQTWIYAFATNSWSLGPNEAAGDANPGYALGILSYMLWDSNQNRSILITTDGYASGFTRIWALHWN